MYSYVFEGQGPPRGVEGGPKGFSGVWGWWFGVCRFTIFAFKGWLLGLRDSQIQGLGVQDALEGLEGVRVRCCFSKHVLRSFMRFAVSGL